MGIRVYLCMLLIGFSTVITLTAQVSGGVEQIEPADSTFQQETGSPDAMMFELPGDSLMSPVQLRSCVNLFISQTVSSFVYVLGCSTLAVQSVTVTGGGNLTLTAPVGVEINGPFDVLLGGVLNICDGSPPPPVGVKYYYDASGNRILRQ